MGLPEDFVKQTRALMGDEAFELLADALEQDAPVSIRLNPFKGGFEPVSHDGRVPWCPSGYYLSSRPAFTFDPLLHAGVYYVQEASSMFLDLVLRQHVSEAVSMLDLCAAPGGKTTVARAALPEGSLLVSNEPVRQRAQVLSENVQKFGHPDVIVTNNMPRDFRRAGTLFDVILTDVPCSGEGMFRKDPAARAEWSLQNVENCWRLQREIVADAWECLREGGLLVYSTCTLNALENEQNVLWMKENLGAQVLDVETEAAWGITGSLLPELQDPVYRFLPGRTRGEGLFMVVVRKGWEGGQTVSQADVRKRVEKRLNVLSNGVKAPERKGKDLIPDHSEALSMTTVEGGGTRCELSYEQALAYLRKEALVLPPETPRGIVLLTFCGVPLGYAKNIGNRANNLYPPEWRIKTTHIPKDYEAILRHIESHS